MDKIKNNLNMIGLALILAAIVGIKLWPYKKIVPIVLAVLGIAALASYFALNLSSLKKGFKRKSFLYSSNLMLVVVLVLAIVVLLNVILARNHHRFDFTQAKLHSLSDQSATVLKALKQDIMVRCFFREGNFGRAAMENLLKNFTYHSGKIKYEFSDPDKNPGLVKRYDVTQDGTSIFEAGDKDNRITTTTEGDAVNALIKITRAAKKTITFLEGHGEHTIEGSDELGYSNAKAELEKLGYEVKKLALALADNFPKDCALLVVPGPQKDLLPNEMETIKTYLETGGRVFFMSDPETATGLIPYLLQFGVKLENDLIVDTVSRLLGGDYFMPVVTEYDYHEITKNFRFATFFPYARSVDALTEGKPDGVTLTVIAKTSPNAWSERELDQKEVAFNKDKDKLGPISLAVVGTVKNKAEEKKAEEANQPPAEDKPETQTEAKPEAKAAPAEAKDAPAEPAAPKGDGRLAVFGDSDFASNRYYNMSANGNLFLNTVNWLTEESDLISIQPKTQNPRTIQLGPSQGRILFFVAVLLIPLAVLILGVSIWIRRRTL
ncbi:MAG: Gldg family protein [Candidatus Aminicenantes bacterium]|nr:Gldg family protein [Candidatus Aminicenantes bacterium]